MYRITMTHSQSELLLKRSIRIVVEKMSFQGLSENVDGDGWVTKLWGKTFQDNRPYEENAREPNIEVDVRWTNSLC